MSPSCCYTRHRAKTELEFSCSVPRAQTITPAERGDALRMCCPHTAVWHSPAIQWRATGDTLRASRPVWGASSAGALKPCGNASSCFLLDTTVQWDFSYQAVMVYAPAMRILRESLETLKTHLDKSPSNHDLALKLAPVWRGWTGNFLKFSDSEAGTGPPHSAFGYQRTWFFSVTMEDPF